MVFGANSQWTVDRDQELSRLVSQSLSALQIAEQLQVTRNMVIGRAHRLRLAWNNKRGRRRKTPLLTIPNPPKIISQPLIDPPPRKKLAGACAPKVHLDVCKKPLPKRFSGLFDGKGISWLEKSISGCCWPFEGRARDGAPLCCGQESVIGRSYCEPHAHISRNGQPKSKPA